MRTHDFKAVCALLILLALTAPLRGADGESTYIIVLREAARNQPAEPDVAAFQGRLLRADGNRRVAVLPDGVIQRLSQHPRVLYIQRLWNGREALQPQTANAVIAPDGAVTHSTQPDWQTGAYLYDRSGNIKSIGADGYSYDSVGRLIRADVSSKIENYTYDPFGNLRLPGAPEIDPSNNRVSTAAYDAAGNLTADSRGTYRYDAIAMMTGHTPAATDTTPSVPRRMIYTADDERIAIVAMPGGAPETTRITVRDLGGKVLREFERSGTDTEWRRDYVYGEGRLLGGERQVPNGDTGYRHFHLDHLGSVRLVTRGGDAARITEVKYAPFGTEVDPSTDEYTSLKYSPLEPMKFAGHERDYYGAVNVPGDDHLDYMHARFYSAAAGRFLSVDPTWESADVERPQAFNRYTYVDNNPLNRIDPDGRAGRGIGRIIEIVKRGPFYKRVKTDVDADELKVAVSDGEDIVSTRDAMNDMATELSGGRTPIYHEPKADGQMGHYHVVDEHGKKAKGFGHLFHWGVGFASMLPYVGTVVDIMTADDIDAGASPIMERAAQQLFGAKYSALTDDQRKAVFEAVKIKDEEKKETKKVIRDTEDKTKKKEQ
jgi:RHS repeat-associated protein